MLFSVTLAKSKTQDNLKEYDKYDKLTLPRAARLAPQEPPTPDRDKTHNFATPTDTRRYFPKIKKHEQLANFHDFNACCIMTDTKTSNSSDVVSSASSNNLKLTPKLTQPKKLSAPDAGKKSASGNAIIRRASDRPVSLRIPARNVPNTQYEDWLFIKKTSALLRRNSSSKKLKNEKRAAMISRSNSQNKESRVGRTVYVKYWCVLADSCLYGMFKM